MCFLNFISKGMIEHGLIECTAYGVHKAISPTMKSKIVGEDGEEFLEIRYAIHFLVLN